MEQKSKPKRRLAAIVFTDIVGFTKLSAKDETKAAELIKRQRTLLVPIIQSHDGAIREMTLAVGLVEPYLEMDQEKLKKLKVRLLVK